MPRRKLSQQSIWDADALRAHMQEHQVKLGHLRSVWKLAIGERSIEDVCAKLSETKNPPPSKWIRAIQRDFVLCTSTVVDFQTKNASAGCKFVVKTQDGLFVEAVVMKADDAQASGRITLCVSSQVGCKMGCTFCETGTLGHLGNLTAGEIVEQLYHAQCWVRSGSLGDTRVRNIVFMGMGEPLDNFKSLRSAVEGMMCEVSFGILGRHITLSTVGVPGKIQQMAEDSLLRQVNLAVSLHAATQQTRLRIVPSAQGFPIESLTQALHNYCQQTSRGIMIEYIVLAGVNDSEDDARSLTQLLNGLNCWLNLIPYNLTSIGESHGFRSPSNLELRSFEKHIRTNCCRDHLGEPISVRTRYSTKSGQDVDSACGQLAAAVHMTNLASQHPSGCEQKVTDVEDILLGSDDAATSSKQSRRMAPQGSGLAASSGQRDMRVFVGLLAAVAILYGLHRSRA